MWYGIVFGIGAIFGMWLVVGTDREKLRDEGVCPTCGCMHWWAPGPLPKPGETVKLPMAGPSGRDMYYTRRGE